MTKKNIRKFKTGDFVVLIGFREMPNTAKSEIPKDRVSSQFANKVLVIKDYEWLAEWDYAVTEQYLDINKLGIRVMEDQLKLAEFAQTELYKALQGEIE